MQNRGTSATRAWLNSGEVWIWMNAAAVALSITALGALLALIATRGLAHFWPADLTELTIRENDRTVSVVGQLMESETLSAAQFEEATGRMAPDPAGSVTRWLVKTGQPSYRASGFPLGLRTGHCQSRHPGVAHRVRAN